MTREAQFDWLENSIGESCRICLQLFKRRINDNKENNEELVNHISFQHQHQHQHQHQQQC
jgi:hypothetical protein